MSIASVPPHRRLLAVDAGSPVTSVAAGCGPEVLALRESRGERSSSDLLRLIRAALADAGWSATDLDGLIALRGPGSFTGLRVGLATVLGMHQALGVPASGVSSLEATALQASATGRVLAASDALRGDWLVQSFGAGASARPDGDAELRPVASLAAFAPCTVVGFGVSELASTPGWSPEIALQEARALAPEALALAARPGFTWDPGLLVRPIYARPPAASPGR